MLEELLENALRAASPNGEDKIVHVCKDDPCPRLLRHQRSLFLFLGSRLGPKPARGAHIGLGTSGGSAEAEGESRGRGRGFRLLRGVCGVCAASFLSFLSQQHWLPEKEPYTDGT